MEINNCYQLDEYHCLAKLEDAQGVLNWYLFTFKKPIVNNIVTYDGSFNGNEDLWDMKQIDPNNFEWNGNVVYLIENKI